MKKVITCIYSVLLISLLSVSSVSAESIETRKTYAVMWIIDTNDAGFSTAQ